MVVLECLESGEAGGTGDQFMGEFGFVGLLVAAVPVVHLVVSLLGIICGGSTLYRRAEA